MKTLLLKITLIFVLSGMTSCIAQKECAHSDNQIPSTVYEEVYE